MRLNSLQPFGDTLLGKIQPSRREPAHRIAAMFPPLYTVKEFDILLYAPRPTSRHAHEPAGDLVLKSLL